MENIKTYEGFFDFLKKSKNNIESEIHKICKQYHIKNYKINKDGSIDITTSTLLWSGINLYDYRLTELPLKFNKTNCNFTCSKNKLTSLEGSPKEVNGDFICSHNELTTFKGSPKIIRGFFGCDNNNIKSFEYFPSFVGFHFYCINNPIYEVWRLFGDTTKIELLNDFDIFRDEDTDTPGVVMCILNDFLNMIGVSEVKYVPGYKNI